MNRLETPASALLNTYELLLKSLDQSLSLLLPFMVIKDQYLLIRHSLNVHTADLGLKSQHMSIRQLSYGQPIKNAFAAETI